MIVIAINTEINTLHFCEILFNVFFEKNAVNIVNSNQRKIVIVRPHRYLDYIKSCKHFF